MKFLVLNSSGNVGKSTVSREVLYSFLENPKLIEIETVNSSSEHFNINVEKITDLTFFEDLYLKILENDNLIMDIGASNLSLFCEKIGEFAGIDMLFDYFIIPTVSGDKVATDTARTILFLKSLGVENDKIKVVFNNSSNINEFDILFRQEEKIGYTFDKSLFVPKSNLFKELGILRKTINEIYCENVDIYKDDILNAEAKDKIKLIKTDLANRMAVSIRPKLIDVFELITNNKAVNNLCFVDEKKAVVKAKKEVEEDLTSDEDDEEL